jgi:crotonobetainyl-CoA:carnitine CoA-transferase CaiB-like acyl-CoA transferase
MNRAILNGIRVLDFSRVLAGPYATRILADFGAEVIKVQSQKTATGTDLNTGRYFSNWNRNKRSITLDMSCPEARALALKLVAISDVVVENFSPRVMANWRLDYAALNKANPELIMVSISAMGQTGPWRDFVAYGSTVQALGGLTYLTAYDKDEPVGPGYAYADTIAGLYGALAVLAALEFRESTGRGQHIDLSEYEAVCTLIGPALMDVIANNAQILPSGNQSDYGTAAPHGCYRCLGKDKWCVIAVFTEAEWQALVKVLGSPGWTDTERFSTLSKRNDHSEELDERLDKWTSKHTAEEVVALLQAAGVPAGIVQNAEDLANDPHLLERNWFVKLQHPTLGEKVSDGSPIRLSQSSTSNWKSSPLLGEDNRYVYTELIGLTDQQFSSYVEKGIIA